MFVGEKSTVGEPDILINRDFFPQNAYFKIIFDMCVSFLNTDQFLNGIISLVSSSYEANFLNLLPTVKYLSEDVDLFM